MAASVTIHILKCRQLLIDEMSVCLATFPYYMRILASLLICSSDSRVYIKPLYFSVWKVYLYTKQA